MGGSGNTGRLQQQRYAAAHGLIIVQDMHHGGPRGLVRRRLLTVDGHWLPSSDKGGLKRAACRVKRKIVPPPGFGSAQSRPPCASTIEWEIDNPTPMPSLRVVTNGSNSRSATSGARPGPVSATEISTMPDSVMDAATVTSLRGRVPSAAGRSAMAWAALRIRLT